MKFYSGFSLSNEKSYFETYIKKSAYTVSGFSYGAIKAFKYVQEELKQGKRVDTLQLFSPAFFQTKSEKFKRLQTVSYTKNKEKYLKQFISGCFAPYEQKEIYQCETTLEELEELLYYEWSVDELLEIVRKGVIIEVYLGGQDRIVDAVSAQEVFLEVATVTYIKSANHFLQIN